METFDADKYNKYFQVLYEDNHLVIVNKAGGMLVQGDKTGDKTLGDWAKEYIKERYDKPGNVYLGIPHRIDRPVSGIVILTRTSKALERMNQIFRSRKIQKTYWAIVKRKPANTEGKLVHWLKKDQAKNKVTAYDEAVEGAQKAETRYKVLGKLNDHWLLEVNPITGRPHQIRVQLASMGCPIRGDVKYGFPRKDVDNNIHLHARRIYFVHPIKKEPIVCVAGLPDSQFWEQFLVFDDPSDIKNKNLDFLY